MKIVLDALKAMRVSRASAVGLTFVHVEERDLGEKSRPKSTLSVRAVPKRYVDPVNVEFELTEKVETNVQADARATVITDTVAKLKAALDGKTWVRPESLARIRLHEYLGHVEEPAAGYLTVTLTWLVLASWPATPAQQAEAAA